jgi:hypothetical protein
MRNPAKHYSWFLAPVVGAALCALLPGAAAAVPTSLLGADAGHVVGGVASGDLLMQTRARGGGGGRTFHGGSRGFRGGHHVQRHRGFYAAPFLAAPLYYGYSYYDDDCDWRETKVRRCWVDNNGDRQCGWRRERRRYCS